MELREGYKNTELGVIPEHWEVKTIGDVFTFYSTSNFSKAEMTLDGEVGCVHYGLIHAIPHTSYSLAEGTKYYITKEQAKYENIQNGDVIMVDASEDLIGLNKSVEVYGIGNEEYISGLHTFHLRDKNSIFIDTCRGLILNCDAVKKQMLRAAVGMKVFGVSKPQLQRIFVPVPTIEEQTAIATALSDADALISSLEELIAKKRNIKQGAMQQLLQPKEGWEVKKLGDLFKLSASNSKSGYLTDEGKYIVMDMGAVSSEGTILKSKRTNLNSDILNYGDLVMPKDDIGGGNIIGKVGYIDKTDSYVLGDHVYKLELITSKIDSLYFYFLINSVYINKHFRAKASGSAQLGLGRKSVLEQELIYPCTKEEQTRIATILSDMDAEISALESKLEKYRKVKLGMMQNLLTGKIRLV